MQNSNLVLQADTRLIERRPRDEATGEVMSLSSKIQGTKMGDRYQRTKPLAAKSEDGKKKLKKLAKTSESSKYELSKLKGQSLLSEDVGQMVGIMYRPKTPATRQFYESILKFITESLGDQPRDVLCGAADEILQVLKNDKLKEKDKRKETESLIGSMTEERYAVLVNLSKKLTDYGVDEKSSQPHPDENLDETYGVNVQFEESDEDSDDDIVDEVREDEDEDEIEGEEPDVESAIHATNLDPSVSTKSRDSRGKSSSVHPREIDAYWLQRKLSKTYDDPVVAQSRAAEVLKILKIARDDHEIENQLVVLLGFDQFDFIKVLRQNRMMILYCTLLAQAQTQQEKNKLKDIMKSDPEKAKILRMLEATDVEQSSEGDKKEARSSRTKNLKEDEVEDENAAQLAKCKMLDLEDMAFVQGSHFMANKRCQLPDGSFRKQRKGCEIIHVPALKPKPFDPNEVSFNYSIN